MTRPRRQRIRNPNNTPVVDALISGAPIEFSQDTHTELVCAYFFGEPPLPKAALDRARDLLDEWQPLIGRKPCA